MNRVNRTNTRILRIAGGATGFPGQQLAPPQQTTSKKRKTPTPTQQTKQTKQLNQKLKKMKV